MCAKWCDASLMEGTQADHNKHKHHDRHHMKTTLSTHEIADALKRDENAAWSWAGAKALAEYLEELEADTGEEMELDIVAIRCDFSEDSSLAAWAEGYFGGITEAREGLGLDEDACLDEEEDKIRNYISERGTLIEFDGGVIVSSF
jgi:hypothetical protein